MQTLFIPEKIIIEIKDENGNSFCQEDIIVGIKIFANQKNDIEISPFLSNKNGIIIITKTEIENNFQNFISYGLMDYSSLESAKSEIEIYYFGKNKIDNYIKYWTNLLKNKTDLKQFEIWGEKLGKLEQISAQIERKEREELEIYFNCKNLKFNEKENLILIKDKWENPKVELNYEVELRIK